MQRADKAGARVALILGEDELAAGTITVRMLRAAQTTQETVPPRRHPRHRYPPRRPGTPMSTADADQIEHLRRLWDQYGRLLTVAVVAVLLGVFGKLFLRRLSAAPGDRGGGPVSPPISSRRPGRRPTPWPRSCAREYPRTSYASFVALAQAKQAVEAGKLDVAEQHLRWVVEHAGEPTDRALASLRLARVLLDQGKAQAAQDALGKDIPASSPALAEIRGDIAHAQNRPQEARQAYQEALAGLPPESGQAALIKLKLDALGQP